MAQVNSLSYAARHLSTLEQAEAAFAARYQEAIGAGWLSRDGKVVAPSAVASPADSADSAGPSTPAAPAPSLPTPVFVITYDESTGLTDQDRAAAESLLGPVVWFKIKSGSRSPEVSRWLKESV